MTKGNDLCHVKNLGGETANGVQKLQITCVSFKDSWHTSSLFWSKALPLRNERLHTRQSQRFLSRQDQYPKGAVDTAPQQNTAFRNFRKLAECGKCGKTGNIARFYRQKVRQGRGKSGHVTSECLRYRQERQIRRPENAWTSDSDTVNTAEINRRGKNSHVTEAQIQSVGGE